MDGGIPARVISDMRVTIPEEYREKYDLEENDRVWVKVEPIEGKEWKGGGPMARLQDGE